MTLSETLEKIIRIETCYDCPFYTVSRQHDGVFLQKCLKTSRYIDCLGFPDFCPLEDGGKKEKDD